MDHWFRETQPNDVGMDDSHVDVQVGVGLVDAKVVVVESAEAAVESEAVAVLVVTVELVEEEAGDV